MTYSLDERILGYALSDKGFTLKVVNEIPSDYLRPEFQELYNIIRRCVKKYNETPTIRMVQCDDKWSDSLLEAYNKSLTYKDSDNYNPSDFALDSVELKNRYNVQVLLKCGKEVFKQNWNGSSFVDLENANKTIRQTVAEIDRIRISKVYKEGTLKDTADEAWEKYEAVKKDPDSAKGILLGLRELDRITNGLQPAELVLIGGESSSGKSALSMNMAINAWRGTNQYPEEMEWVSAQDYKDDGHNVMYFTIEMPFNPLRRRIDACLAGVPLYGIRDGNLTPEEEMRYKAALEFQKNYKKQFKIIDIPRGCTVAQIEAKYMELLYQFTPELVVVDYISLMSIDSYDNQDWLNVGKLAEMLHEFCRTYGIPCITPVQLTRKDNSVKNSAPDQHRVGRSIMLPQNCNILLNIDSKPDDATRPVMDVHIAKMRDGERGAFSLHKRLDIMRIYDDIPGWTPETYGDTTDEVSDGYRNS